jgi:glyoxylase-like metal-dependent hydrolase (beta-lactamase superfamily II)
MGDVTASTNGGMNGGANGGANGGPNGGRWVVGDVVVTSVVETEGPTPGQFLFDDATPEAVLRHRWLQPHFADDRGRLIARVQLLVIESDGKRIAVDTCVGNDKERSMAAWHLRQLPFLDWMTSAGFPPQSIDLVACTHLHVDHVGWNTMLVDGRWVPTFPRARYVFGSREFEHWRREPQGDGDVFGDSVQPVVDAGLVDLVDDHHRLTPEVSYEPTPGHTPGHLSVRIRSQGHEAVITGDLMHHPILASEPTWSSRFDSDVEMARATRRRFVEEQTASGCLVIGTHFASPTAGRFVADGAVHRFEV